MKSDLIKKYNVSGPRYTSYPTVPTWEQDKFSKEKWLTALKNTFTQTNTKEGISLYIHLPFCESLCTFCGCHKRITKNHSVEEKYIETVLKEWNLYVNVLGELPVLQELHLGGGTPTFFKPENLDKLITGIKAKSLVPEKAKWSLEGHPNNTSEEHLNVLIKHGFSRISFGVQDYDPVVQKAINRIQPLEHVVNVTQYSKKIGFKSICHDLVYGLPFQKMTSIQKTVKHTLELKPDRIALYSYAHVPWIKGNGQRGFKDGDIPKDDEKRALYEYAKSELLKNGYKEIGIDHFALPDDELYIAYASNNMHRNFMGYSDSKTEVMIGLGASSISDSWTAFAQNEKSVEAYYSLVENNEIPVVKGHILTEEDLEIRKYILNLMCHGKTTVNTETILDWELVKKRMNPLVEDGIISLEGKTIIIEKIGHAFIRNVCMCLDTRFHSDKSDSPIFSKVI